jgi:hypothetical protein
VEIPEAVILAVVTAVIGGIALVYKNERTEKLFYRDRLLTSLDTTDEAIDTARKIAAPKKRAPGS